MVLLRRIFMMIWCRTGIVVVYPILMLAIFVESIVTKADFRILFDITNYTVMYMWKNYNDE